MKVLLSIFVVLGFIGAIAVDAFGQTVGHTVGQTVGQTITKQTRDVSSSGGVYFYEKDPFDIHDPHIMKCLHNKKEYEAGNHKLEDCKVLQCNPYGLSRVIECPIGGLTIRGGKCDEGVPVYPEEDQPYCCVRRYICEVVV